MPQNNVLPDWRATYPNDAPAQKPGGVTVSTTATAPRVPNKFTYAAGTIQSVDLEMMIKTKIADEVREQVQEAAPHTQDEVEEAEMEEAEENGVDGEDDDGPGRTVKRTTTRTTTTTKHRR